MARLASQEKVGYFLLPIALIASIASHIQKTNNGRFPVHPEAANAFESSPKTLSSNIFSSILYPC